MVSGTLVLLPPRRNAAFIPVDESQGLAVAEIAKACGKTDHTRQQERCLGLRKPIELIPKEGTMVTILKRG